MKKFENRIPGVPDGGSPENVVSNNLPEQAPGEADQHRHFA